ncbi:MAG: PIN domain-containing protein [Deltaproteobacteria bacterium]|nr:PIN domain-containing protein [Deltaproteobacteria bacterium]
MKRLQEFLKNHPVIGLDASIFIYHLEDHPRYSPLTEIIFDTLENRKNRGITSYLTLTEILVKPKTEGLPQVSRDYEYYLTTFPNLTFYEMGLDVARKASDLIASDRIKSPDAIQLATAILHGATVFITNDKIFERVKGVDVLVLDKFLKP